MIASATPRHNLYMKAARAVEKSFADARKPLPSTPNAFECSRKSEIHKQVPVLHGEICKSLTASKKHGIFPA
jgi:hypothetical protein